MIGLQQFSEIPKRIERFHCTHMTATDLDRLYSGLWRLRGAKECADLASFPPSTLRLRDTDDYNAKSSEPIFMLSIHLPAHAIDILLCDSEP